jgi:dipeptidyl aminopeptidase/acylaminoacyl peptidase
MSKKSKKSKDINSRLRYFWWLILVGGIAGASWLGYSLVLSQSTETGQLSDQQTYPGENLSHSLDLRLAAKAAYPSTALSLVKDLGTIDGLKQRIVSFGVPTDGLTEYGLLMLPSTPKPASGYPTLILCHGYVNPSEYVTTRYYISDMEFYASHGFAVIKPDFRGQGLSSGQGLPEGAYYSMAYNTDVISLISSLKQTDYIDKSKLNIWGHSMGAYIALRASVISKDIKNTVILSGAVGSFKQMYLSYIPPSDENNPEALRIRSNIFSKYGTPAEDTAFWKNASPDSFLSRTTANIQIHVGLLDTTVPPELSADLDADLSAIHKNHQYYVYQDGRHGLVAERSVIWLRSLALLQRN